MINLQPCNFAQRRPAPVAFWLSLCLCGLVLSTSVQADPQADKISRIKAAFVYNITKFVEWPDIPKDSRQTPFAFCHYREDLLGRGFDSIADKTIQRRAVKKRLIGGLRHASICDLILIPESQLDRFQNELASTRPGPALTIADLTQQDTRQNSHDIAMINLIRDGRGIGFEVNLTPVKQNGLSISSELLKLARTVTP